MKIEILKNYPFKGEKLLAGSTISTVGPDEPGVKEADAKRLIDMGVARQVV